MIEKLKLPCPTTKHSYTSKHREVAEAILALPLARNGGDSECIQVDAGQYTASLVHHLIRKWKGVRVVYRKVEGGKALIWRRK